MTKVRMVIVASLLALGSGCSGTSDDSLRRSGRSDPATVEVGCAGVGDCPEGSASARRDQAEATTQASPAPGACASNADCAPGFECEIQLERGVTTSSCKPHGKDAKGKGKKRDDD